LWRQTGEKGVKRKRPKKTTVGPRKVVIGMGREWFGVGGERTACKGKGKISENSCRGGRDR